MDPQVFKGSWYIPDNPDHRLGGTLDFTTESGLHLEIYGGFASADTPIARYPVIWGVTTQGKQITLLDCLETSRRRTSRRGTTVSTTYQARWAIIGFHLPDEQDARFHQASIEYSHLPLWVDTSSFEFGHQDDRFTLAWVPSSALSLLDGTDYHVTLFSSYGESIGQDRYCITHRPVIALEFDSPQTLDSIHTLAWRINNLLTFLVGERATITSFQVSPGPPESANVLYRQIVLPGPRVVAAEMNLPLSGLGTRTPTVFENWLLKYEQFQPVYDLYFGTLYQSGMYMTQEFLSLVQALEIYHRRFISNEVVPHEMHIARLEQVLSAVPGNLRKWVKGCLKYSNEPRLAQRLSQVFQAQSAIFKGDNDMALAERIADTRNYLVHYDQKLAGKALSGQDLFKVSARLRLTLEIAILGQLGFSEDDISELIRKQGNWLQTVRYLH